MKSGPGLIVDIPFVKGGTSLPVVGMCISVPDVDGLNLLSMNDFFGNVRYFHGGIEIHNRLPLLVAIPTKHRIVHFTEKGTWITKISLQNNEMHFALRSMDSF